MGLVRVEYNNNPYFLFFAEKKELVQASLNKKNY